MNAAIFRRFLNKIEIAKNGCWVWLACTTKGYGRIKVGDHVIQAHRLSYEHYISSIPSGFELDHLCRNRSCVNPEHLEVVTCRENILRGESPAAQAARRMHCLNGHPWDKENTHITKDGSRYCRVCHKLSERRRKAKIKSGRI